MHKHAGDVVYCLNRTTLPLVLCALSGTNQRTDNKPEF